MLLALCSALPLRAAEEKMTTVYLVLLKKGPAWTPEATAATQEIQKGHMANIHKMWDAKKLIVAGPIEDADLRGIFVIQAASLDEAKSLAAEDPAVKAGRLTASVYSWWVEKRALPEAGSYCTPAPGK
jgi:uncharacterized protein YciI